VIWNAGVLQRRQRRGFILLHESAVANYIDCKNGGEAAFLGHLAQPLLQNAGTRVYEYEAGESIGPDFR
jgi:hypothetical protein